MNLYVNNDELNLQEQFMEDVGLLLRVCVMLLPLPVFWALFTQQVATFC